MPIYQVWYEKNSQFIRSYFQPVCNEDTPLGETHTHVRDVEGESLDEVYIAQQAERWSSNGEAVPLIEQLGIGHTSMSPGDVLRDPDGSYWECRPTGWLRLDWLDTNPIRQEVAHAR